MATTDITNEPVDAAPAVVWDGKHAPYRPVADVPIDDRLKLHAAPADPGLDPITFEVLSTKLWNINEEHADTIQRVSGSPVVVENYDFNTCITTERGEPFLFAPYIQYFAGAAEYLVKYTLENRSRNPGIEPGDVFVHNDCLVGGSHQMDVGMYAPVFVDGELFCWVFNACHASDLGGSDPGSFCINARDIYAEAPMLRAIKLADSDGIRGDIEDMMMRFSRVPQVFALEIRSQLAGVNRARTRIEELCAAYSPDVVKATMNKLIDDAEASAAERLRRVPDGRWTDVVYCGGAFPGDRDVHKTVVTMEKRGDRLFFDNFGTDPQVAAFNCGFGQWRSAIACALSHMLAHDHKFCVGGVLRRCEFDAQIGTISTVDRNGAFSTLHPQVVTVPQAERVIGKMLYPDPETRRQLMATSGVTTCGWLTHFGVDQWGSPFATVTLDHTAGGQGAFATRDGLDQCGTPVWPKSEAPDVEAWERHFPVLYLYRRGAHNAGHGKHRGGNGVEFAFVGHGTETQHAASISVASGTPVNAGVFGGLHGATGRFYAVGGSDVRARFAAGEIPSSPQAVRALEGDGRQLAAKTFGLPLGVDDVIEQSLFGGGGYGDPLERDLDLVAADLADGSVSVAATTSIYGAVLDAGGRVDRAASEARRDELRARRLAAARAPARRPASGGGSLRVIVEVAEALAIADVDGTPMLVCTRGEGTVLCGLDENYKDHVAQLETSLHELAPEVHVDPRLDTDADVVYRQYLCPVTGTLLDSELTLRDEPPVWDMRVDPASLVR